MADLYIVGTVSLATILFFGYAAIRSKLRSKKRHAAKKKRKAVWIRIV